VEGSRARGRPRSGRAQRPIAYANNDLPGTMLAGAGSRVKRYGVRPGTRAVVFTTNDSAYATALALRDADVAIAAIVDARPDAQITGALPQRARALGLPIVAASGIVGAHGGKRVTAVDIAPLAGGATRWLDCDLVCVSGGWNPAVHLFSHARGTLRYDETLTALLPEASPLPIQLPIRAAGAANGRFGLAPALADGHAAGLAAPGKFGGDTVSPALSIPETGNVESARTRLGERAGAQPRRQTLRRPADRCHRRYRACRARGLRRSSI
jgi:sarcosine oxidase subunit alpha